MLKIAASLILNVVMIGMLASCAASGPKSKRMTGQTYFLDGSVSNYHPNSRHAGNDASPAKNHDDVSWWEGYGVSGAPKIEISLGDQMARFYKGNQLVGEAFISTGKDGKETPIGSFRVTQRSRNHRSNLYGVFEDSEGNVIDDSVDIRLKRPPAGARFVPAEMPFFLRFNGAVGLHASNYVTGSPASNGCVRLTHEMAELFFDHAPNGTPVIVKH